MSSLSIVNNAISLPGVAFKKNAVLFEKPLSLDQLKTIASGVVEMQGGTTWWLGDIGLAIQEHNRSRNELEAAKHDAKVKHLERELEHVEGAERKDIRERIRQHEADAKKLRDASNHYTPGYAEALGIDSGHWWNCVMLSKYYPPLTRSEGLSPTHHHLAMCAARATGGTIKEARGWLARAQEKGWGVSELRKQINLARASAPASQPPLDNEWSAFDEADKLVTSRKADTLTPDQARLLLSRWRALLEFVDRLKSIAAETPTDAQPDAQSSSQ